MYFENPPLVIDRLTGQLSCLEVLRSLKITGVLAKQRFFLFLVLIQGFMGRIFKQKQGVTKFKMRYSGTPVRFWGKGMRYSGDTVSFLGAYYEVFGERAQSEPIKLWITPSVSFIKALKSPPTEGARLS